MRATHPGPGQTPSSNLPRQRPAAVRLDTARAPAPWLPLSGFWAIPLWALVAGWLLACHGAELVSSRWTPAALALVHVFVLGLLLNGVLGSLQQFLPVAMAADTRLLRRVGPAGLLLHNLGSVLLVGGFLDQRGWLPWAAGLLLAGLSGSLLAALWALRRALRPVPGQGRMAIALCSLLGTVTLGAALAGGWSPSGIERAALVDVHAALGLVCGLLALIAAVGSVVLPMFLGLPVWTESGQHRMWAASAGLLLAAMLARLSGHLGSLGFAALAALPAAALAVAVLRGLYQRQVARRAEMAGFWGLGALALLVSAMGAAGAAALALPLAGPAALLAVGAALPAVLCGMLLEIVPFLLWNDLVRRRRPHQHLPSIDALLPPPAKRRLLRLALAAALCLPLLAATAAPQVAWLAGALQGAVALGLAAVLWRVCARARAIGRSYRLS